MKIYLTLNEEKHKDSTIIKYLESQYSKSGAIKAILYQIAVNDGNKLNNDIVPKMVLDKQKADDRNKMNNINIKNKKVNISEFIV
ncbi:hypothetical protein [Clostridium butyricum]|uniref:hypothetical protein n=1 Tax=Clostridium butyricum TaxID=1492 RepID=UPI002AB2E299|nr:hypothetical protein [Clostridium butyricum]